MSVICRANVSNFQFLVTRVCLNDRNEVVAHGIFFLIKKKPNKKQLIRLHGIFMFTLTFIDMTTNVLSYKPFSKKTPA